MINTHLQSPLATRLVSRAIASCAARRQVGGQRSHQVQSQRQPTPLAKRFSCAFKHTQVASSVSRSWGNYQQRYYFFRRSSRASSRERKGGERQARTHAYCRVRERVCVCACVCVCVCGWRRRSIRTNVVDAVKGTTDECLEPGPLLGVSNTVIVHHSPN